MCSVSYTSLLLLPFCFQQGNNLQVSLEEECKPLFYRVWFTEEGASVMCILQKRNRIPEKLNDLVRGTHLSAKD